MDPHAVDDLVDLARSGDGEAFRVLVLELQADVGLFLAPRCSGGDTVDELVQRTFVTAYQRLATYQRRGTFTAWLKGIAYNHLRDHYRERRRSREVHVDALEQVIAGTIDDQLDEDEVDIGDDLGRLADCLQTLKPRARTMIERRYRDGVSLKQLAQQFSKPRQTIASTLFRIRNALRSCIEGGA